MNLKEKMADKFLDAPALARKTGMSAPAVWKIVSGKQSNITMKTAQKICESIGCEFKDVFEVE
jgi:DNA-binding Xre family transcriptional regulator